MFHIFPCINSCSYSLMLLVYLRKKKDRYRPKWPGPSSHTVILSEENRCWSPSGRDWKAREKAVSKLNRVGRGGGECRSVQRALYSLRCVEFAFCITAVLGCWYNLQFTGLADNCRHLKTVSMALINKDTAVVSLSESHRQCVLQGQTTMS